MPTDSGASEKAFVDTNIFAYAEDLTVSLFQGEINVIEPAVARDGYGCRHFVLS